jgi:hypothetical protein
VAVTCLLLLTMSWAPPALAATPPWWDCDWEHRRKLTFNNSAQAENLQNFPVLVILNTSRIDYSKTQDSGQDLRFLDADGSLLDYEIEKWDESGTSYVWVKVPQIDASSTTDHIWMYYGNPSAPAGQNPTGVWTNSFQAVWHLHSDVNDSTNNNHDATNYGSVTAAGVAADGQNFNGSSHYIDANFISNYGAGQDFTWEGWFKLNGVNNSDDIAGIEDRAAGAPSGLPEIRLSVRDDDSNGEAEMYNTWITPDTGTAYNGDVTITNPDDGTWHYAVLLRSGNSGRLYYDGTEVDNALVSTDALTFRTTLLIGAQWDTAAGGSAKRNWFKGDMDEVRLSTAARSAAWISATYKTIKDTFVSYGSQETQDCPPPQTISICGWEKRRKLTFGNSFSGSETLTDFPVLVVLNSSRIDYGKTQDAGQDLRFYDADGTTQLAHEIEKWNESGTSYVWVKVPQIDGGSTTDHIWMYYGNATAADGQNRTAVWSNGFQAVWHLHSDFNDSTANVHHGTNNGSVNATGVAADGQNFNGSSHYIDSNFSSNYGASQDFTWEGWFKVNGIGGSDDILGIEDRGAGDLSEIRLAVRENLTGAPNPIDAYDTWIRPDSGTSYAGTPSIAPANNTWHHAALLRDGGTARLYLNGSQVNTASVATNALNFPVTLLIGAQWDTDTGGGAKRNYFQGDLDEIRLSTAARSAGWIKATHVSITDTFITYGSEEPNGSEVGYFTPDAAAAGMNVPVTFVGNICAVPTVTTSSSDIVVGPSIVTDAAGAVVTANGRALSTVFFLKPEARPTTGITVSVDGKVLSQTFDIVIPTPDPNATSGTVTLSTRTDRGTTVLGGLTVGSGATLKISTSDIDGSTAGIQGYLPTVILVKGDANIAGTVDVNGQDGTNAGAGCTGGAGGSGGPGGGGGGGGAASGTCGSSGTPPAVDTVSTIKVEPQGSSSKTVSHTTSGSNRLMIIGVSINPDNDQYVTSVTYAGQALTKLAHAVISDDARAELWYRVAPATGTNDAVVTFNRGNEDGGVIGVMTFTGVDQTTPFGTHATATGDGTSASVNVSSATGQLVFGVFASEAEDLPTLTVGPGQTEYWNIRSDIHDGAFGGGSTEPGASTVTMSWSLSSADDWAIVAVPIKPAPGGATAATGGVGYSGGGGGGAKGAGSTGGAGGAGTGAVGSPASGTTGGAGGVALAGATGGGGAPADPGNNGGNGGGGGTGGPFGTGGAGAPGGGGNDGGAGGEGGGGGGAAASSPGGGGGGGLATAGTNAADSDDFGKGGLVNSNAQLVPIAGGSGGGGGGSDIDVSSIGGGGGGGGGALLIYATGSVTVSGTITTAGGNGGAGYGSGSGGGGAGSGGAILLQSGTVSASGTFTTAGGTGGTSSGSAAGGAGGTGRIRIDGQASGATVPGTAGSKFIGPVIDTIVDTTVKGRGDGGSTITVYVYDATGTKVDEKNTGASGSSGTVGTWSVSGVTFPSGTGFLAVKQTTGSGTVQVLGPGRATKGVHIINWREVY